MHKGAWTRLPEMKQALWPGGGRRTTESPELDGEAEPRSQAICPLGQWGRKGSQASGRQLRLSQAEEEPAVGSDFQKKLLKSRSHGETTTGDKEEREECGRPGASRVPRAYLTSNQGP